MTTTGAAREGGANLSVAAVGGAPVAVRSLENMRASHGHLADVGTGREKRARPEEAEADEAFEKTEDHHESRQRVADPAAPRHHEGLPRKERGGTKITMTVTHS